MLQKKDFGDDFKWGVTISAFQNEGSAYADGKTASVWDTFCENRDVVRDEIDDSIDFYNRYEEDIEIAAALGFKVFRFSLSWPRILPKGVGEINHAGIGFYNRVVNKCLAQGLEPWITLYHWDLPQVLEDEGGWTNRKILDWFSEYVEVCTIAFGDRVHNWIVMNEPMSFIGLGYFMGYHAPGRKGIVNFLKAAHHATLCMAEGGRIIRKNVPLSNVGVALSCSYVKPVSKLFFHHRAAKRMEGLLNRFFLEPLLGMGYPTDVMPSLNVIKAFFLPGDNEKLAFDFDFFGIQYYFRVVTQFSLNVPVLFANQVPVKSNPLKLNEMEMDVYPKGMYKILKFYSSYPQIKKMIVTESGLCSKDFVRKGFVNDAPRRKYHQKILKYILKARKRKIPVAGYFAWTLVDNFEWRDGFSPKFGLVHVDLKTLKRTVKLSGEWFRSILNP